MASRSLAALRQYGGSDRQGDEAEARRLAFGAAKLAGDDALSLCWAGYVLCYMSGDLEAGENLIDRALARNENLAVAWQLRALASLWLGEPQGAINQIARATRLNPRDPEVFRSEFVMALALLFEGKEGEATPWARKCLVSEPNWPPGAWMAASVLAHAGYIDDARNIAKHLRTLVPGTTVSRYKSLAVFRRHGDVMRVMEGLRLAGLPE
jgi:adenylate cyclase